MFPFQDQIARQLLRNRIEDHNEYFCVSSSATCNRSGHVHQNDRQSVDDDHIDQKGALIALLQAFDELNIYVKLPSTFVLCQFVTQQ